jgi:hypothetical protein
MVISVNKKLCITVEDILTDAKSSTDFYDFYISQVHDSIPQTLCIKAEAFLSFKTSRPALRPSQPPIKEVTSTLSPGSKWPGCEADHSLPPTAESYEEMRLYLHPTICFHAIWRQIQQTQ